MIWLITALASCIRAASFALSPAANALMELAKRAAPLTITDNFFMFFHLFCIYFYPATQLEIVCKPLISNMI